MKLGKLLLKGMLRRKARPRPPRAPLPRLPRQQAPLPKPAKTGAAVTRRSATKALTRSVTPPGRTAALPQTSPETPADARGLSAAALLHPDERLKSAMEGFLLDQRSEHTRRAYGKDLKRFFKFLIVRGLHREAGAAGAITRGVLVAYKDFLLAEELQHTTIDRHLATLRSFFGWLVDDGIIPVNPAEGVRFLNPKRLSTTVGFTDEEVRRVLALPDLHTRTGSLHYAVLVTLFHCGLRRSELCSLRTTSLGAERGHPVVRLQGKGNSERIIVLVPAVANALKHYFRITGKNPEKDAFLFTPLKNNRTGNREKPLDPSMIFYIVRRYARLAGIKSGVSPHSCRATAISNARDRNVPDRAIQEFAGWASPDMITRYDKRKNAIEKSAAHAITYGADDRAAPEDPAFA